MVTGIGLGSKETTTPAISVILCQSQEKKKKTSHQQNTLTQHAPCLGWKKNWTQPAGGGSLYLKNVASHPELVAGRDADDRADLELPLPWHDLPVDAADVDAGVETGLVVRVHDVPPVGFVRSGGTVVRSLSGSHSISWSTLILLTQRCTYRRRHGWRSRAFVFVILAHNYAGN